VKTRRDRSTYDLLLAELQKARKAAGLTQEELAKRLGRPQSFVSKYERRERRLDVVEFVSITMTLGIDSTAIIRGLEAAITGQPAERRTH